MTNIKEFNLLDVRKNSQIINTLNKVYKLWGYEEVSPSLINKIEIIKAREVINQNELISIVSNKSLCLRPEMTTSIVKLISTRLINKKRPLRLWNNGTIFVKKEGYKNVELFQEKIQSGIELIGYENEYPEIEVFNILFDSIDKLKLKDNCELKFLVSSTTIMDLILKNFNSNIYEKVKKILVNLDHDNLNKLDIDNNIKIILKDLLYTRGEPISVINNLIDIFGNNKVLDDLKFLFNTISPIAKSYGIDIQLDPTFQPHLNLYKGIVFQLICLKENNKIIIARGGRYDELVNYFNPNEKSANGLGFSISVDNLRDLIKEEKYQERKVLILIREEKLLNKALEERKKLHNQGIISILEIRPCVNNQQAEFIMKENKCTDIKWIN
ncbi:MAG: ATP phosphoribosyltransferase regulatory subunit [Prochlorococcus sp. SP3034]|nr:ATP phosphoribosyltransferase regulatory subunit [Prochlorococcus sp. SP3034]|tara:strand:- start:6499 stop:7650 length:1152 start_codon:yes stop_codon:yes gene_type:complete